MCRQVGLDLATDLVPVGPAAHYMMGGVDTDVCGRTSVPALFAAGEVACTGLHGANRLASNSLLEGLVFGARAAAAMQQPPCAAPLRPDRRTAADWGTEELGGDEGARNAADSVLRPLAPDAVRDVMWRCAGLFRDRDGLSSAAAALDAAAGSVFADTPDGACQRQLVTVARLVAHAALRREESRGGHFRADFPERDDLHWKVHLVDQHHG